MTGGAAVVTGGAGVGAGVKGAAVVTAGGAEVNGAVVVTAGGAAVVSVDPTVVGAGVALCSVTKTTMINRDTTIAATTAPFIRTRAQKIGSEMTLVLAHGRSHGMRCAPKMAPAFDLEKATCVDISADLRPDVVVDLTKDGWALPSETYDLVIDTGGLGCELWYRKVEFWSELHRVMKSGGLFYGNSLNRERLETKLFSQLHKDDASSVLQRRYPAPDPIWLT